MLAIAGAIYYERCLEGSWDQYFGSGLRAAAILAERTNCQLHSYLSDAEVESARIVANQYKVSLKSTCRQDGISFTYDHGLSVPRILPAPHLIRHAAAMGVSFDKVLRFGMLEGDAVVQADQVVYDPQSAFDPQPFGGNGSRSKRLAIVCNRHEAQLLSRFLEPDKAAPFIAKSP